ncbi:RHS repeat domain-containing protein [Nonomuraea sp. NPDC055795]
MQRLAIVMAAAVVTFPLSAALPVTAAMDPPSQTQQIGPGKYAATTTTFAVTENDVFASAVGRTHGVVAVDNTLARPASAPASRTDLSVFGPGWQAEFLGGETSRKLEGQNGAILVTDLQSGDTIRYVFKSSVSFPAGGGVQTYEAANGSKVSEVTRWDATAGAMRTTIGENLVIDPGDGAATLLQTYTWQQAGTAGDTWRVTGVQPQDSGISSVGYDAQGRVSTIRQPATDDQPQTELTFQYATSTTATPTAFGDYAGRLKGITQTWGAGAPESVARYGYDSAGLLRSMSDPREDVSRQASYSYDAAGRMTSINSPAHGAWDLTFTGNSAAPAATAATRAEPEPSTAQAYPADDPSGTPDTPGDLIGEGVETIVPQSGSAPQPLQYTDWTKRARGNCTGVRNAWFQITYRKYSNRSVKLRWAEGWQQNWPFYSHETFFIAWRSNGGSTTYWKGTDRGAGHRSWNDHQIPDRYPSILHNAPYTKFSASWRGMSCKAYITMN